MKIIKLCGNCKYYNPYLSEIFGEKMHWGGCELKGNGYRDTEEDNDPCEKWEKNIDGWVGGDCSEYSREERGDHEYQKS